MPQLDQLSDVALSQFFWLAIVLGLIYFGIARTMVPKIQGTVDARDAQIAADLQQASAARDAADALEEGYRERMDKSRGEAAHLTSGAKATAGQATEQRLAEADKSMQAKVDQAAARIGEARKAAQSDLEKVAAEAVQAIVERVSGMTVDPAKARAAVATELSHG